MSSHPSLHIGINVSRHWPVTDGLTHGMRERLLEVLPDGYASRLVRAESLLVRWLEEQDAVSDGEKATYLAGRQTRWHVVR